MLNNVKDIESVNMPTGHIHVKWVWVRPEKFFVKFSVFTSWELFNGLLTILHNIVWRCSRNFKKHKLYNVILYGDLKCIYDVGRYQPTLNLTLSLANETTLQ